MKKLLVIIGFLSIYSWNATAFEADSVAKSKPDTSAQKRKTPEERAESLANRLKEKLDLKDKQIPELKEIFMKREKALDNFWDQIRKSEDDMMADLKKVLSKEQLEKFKTVYKHQAPQPSSPRNDTLPAPMRQKN